MDRAELEQFAYRTSVENDELKMRIRDYEEQLMTAKRKKFVQKSEPTPDQLSFFNEAESEANPEQPEPALEKVRPSRKTKNGKPKKKKEKGARDKMLEPLKKQRVEYSLTPEEQTCPECGGSLHVMKKQVRNELVLIPARVEVRQSVIYSYACRRCENEGTGSPVIRCDAPPLLFDGSLVSPSLAAHIICRKYENRDPLQKISADFQMRGLKLSKQTLANWMCRLSEKYFVPMVNRYQAELKKQPVIHADETELQVLREPGRTAQQKSRMWVFCCGSPSPEEKDSEPVIRQYVYHETRKKEVVLNYLKGYEGYLQSDGYSAYHCLSPKIIEVGCMAHVRRKYYDAVMLLPENARKSKAGPVTGLEYCNKLIALDQERKKLGTVEERKEFKEKKMKPVMKKFFDWAEKECLSPCSDGKKYRDALKYTTSQKEYLNNYLLDGRLEFTNNIAERAIRPFVLGRKNWLFSNTPRGADASAALYSVVETARANGLKPEEYITWALESMRGKDPDKIISDDLLRWSDRIPEECRLPSEKNYEND